MQSLDVLYDCSATVAVRDHAQAEVADEDRNVDEIVPTAEHFNQTLEEVTLVPVSALRHQWRRVRRDPRKRRSQGRVVHAPCSITVDVFEHRKGRWGTTMMSFL